MRSGLAVSTVAAKLKVTSVFQLALTGDPRKLPTTAADFVEEARLSKDDFGGWRVSYAYDVAGPHWRLDGNDRFRAVR